jgi:hypothetical protein
MGELIKDGKRELHVDGKLTMSKESFPHYEYWKTDLEDHSETVGDYIMDLQSNFLEENFIGDIDNLTYYPFQEWEEGDEPYIIKLQFKDKYYQIHMVPIVLHPDDKDEDDIQEYSIDSILEVELV